jgi:phospholipid N-methyltransferase
MSANAANMSKAVLAAGTSEEVLKEGEYETQFGKVLVKKTDDGYKIVIHINGKKLGRQLAMQIAYSLIGPYIAKERVA